MIKTDQPARLTEIGKIKIGMKGETRNKGKKNEFQLPVKLSHFLVTTTEKGPDKNFLHDLHVMKELGASPTEIPIRLLFDDIDLNFFTSYQYYHGRKCICRGDGEKAQRVTNAGKPNQATAEIDCDFGKCEFSNSGKCKVSGILSCTIPFSQYAGGVYRFRTHGWNSVSGILAALQYFKQNTNGVLQGLPLKLKFLKKNTEEHGGVPVVTIVLDKIELFEMRELALKEYDNRKRLGVVMLQLETAAKQSGFLEDTDDAGDVQDEFYEEAEQVDAGEPGASGEDLKVALDDKKAIATEKTEKPAEKVKAEKTATKESVI